MRLASGCYRIADNSRLPKHVVAAGGSVRDAGSTPAASTISGNEHSIRSRTGTGPRAALLHPEHVLVIWGRHIECQLGSRLQLRHGPWVAPLFDFRMSICE